MEPTVRPASPADVDAICRICAAGFRLTTAAAGLPDRIVDAKVAEFYDPERVAREVAPTSRFWQGYVVAELSSEVVGAAGGGMIDETTGGLYVLYLDLDRRGAGIGSRLLDAVTAQQVALGAARQRVSVLADNHHGVPFYLARGFVEVGERRYPDDAGDAGSVRELVLERALGV